MSFPSARISENDMEEMAVNGTNNIGRFGAASSKFKESQALTYGRLIPGV